MSLTVQNDNGTVADANSYVDVSYADSYFSDRGIARWGEATPTEKESSLINSWQYIDSIFTYLGRRVTDTQNTEFPRVMLSNKSIWYTTIPDRVRYAQCEYAVIALDGSLFPSISHDSTGGKITEKTERAHVFVETTKYSSSHHIRTVRSYPAGDTMLSEFIYRSSRLFKI